MPQDNVVNMPQRQPKERSAQRKAFDRAVIAAAIRAGNQLDNDEPMLVNPLETDDPTDPTAA